MNGLEFLYLLCLIATAFSFYAFGKTIGYTEGYFKGRKSMFKVWVDEFKKVDAQGEGK
jgi:hypothetical protein